MLYLNLMKGFLLVHMLLLLANADYISMKLCEVSLSNHSKSEKLNLGIDKLEEMEMKLDCLIQELQDRK